MTAVAFASCLGLFSSVGPAAMAVSASSAPQFAGDRTLQSIAERYYRASWRFEPDVASQTGVHDYDDQLGSYSPRDFQANDAQLQRTLNKLTALPSESLSRDAQIDAAILASSIRESLFYERDFPVWQRRPGFYNDIVDNAIFQLAARNSAPLPVRLRHVVARENEIPGLFAQAEHNIDPAQVASIVAQFAAEDVDGTAVFLAHDVPKAFANVHDRQLWSRFQTSNRTAIRAAQAYAQYIRKQVLPRAHGSFALGADHYQYLASLENAQQVPIAQLLAAGQAALARDTTNFQRAAKTLNPNVPVAEAYAEMTGTHPRADQLIPLAQRQLAELLTFIHARHIIDIPNAPVARVVPTPEFAASTTEASFDSPGPLEQVATETYYNVTVPKHMSARELDAYLGEFNPFTLMIVSVHEIYPGHLTNYLFNQRARLSLIRKIEWNSAFGEGWAHYSEQMMVDQGLGGGDPRYRLAQAEEALLRDCRLIVGIKEHTQGMTVDQATQFFMKYGMQAHPVAYAEAVRGTTDPLYGHYTWGKLMLLKLRADYQRQHGSSYSLAHFNDAVLSHGDPPIAFLRKLLLGPQAGGSLL